MRTIETAGSGARYLPPDGPWARELLKMVTAQDAGRITPQAVASTFARLNNQVAQADTRVGQRCIVAWRFQKGGGSQALFDGTKEERPTPFLEIPTIATGLDVNAIAQMTVRCVMPSLEDALRLGGIMEVDTETIKAELAKLPEEPDDTLI